MARRGCESCVCSRRRRHRWRRRAGWSRSDKRWNPPLRRDWDVIPYADLQSQYRSIKTEIDAAVLRVLDSAQFILGDEVVAFEREFAAYCRTADSIALNSGTSALHVALLAAGIGPGDEVITVPFTF